MSVQSSLVMHPIYAYEMLYPIEYLRPALDIPYCHHERWDGSGYPRGLKGEDIPLSARLFAVVDVWDALCSDRPYRKGWTAERVREYIASGLLKLESISSAENTSDMFTKALPTPILLKHRPNLVRKNPPK